MPICELAIIKDLQEQSNEFMTGLLYLIDYT